MQPAHRWLLGHLRGAPLQPGEVACHYCDNPPCCNARHLYVGTQADNIRDAMVRGRHVPPPRAMEAKTTCPAGHPYDEANTWIRRTGSRQCRACDRARKAARAAA